MLSEHLETIPYIVDLDNFNFQVYEKAIDEAKYCNLYAQLCHRLRHDVPNFDDADKKTNVRF